MDRLETIVTRRWTSPQANDGQVTDTGGFDLPDHDNVIDPAWFGSTFRHDLVDEMMTSSFGIAYDDTRRGRRVREMAGYPMLVRRSSIGSRVRWCSLHETLSNQALLQHPKVETIVTGGKPKGSFPVGREQTRVKSCGSMMKLAWTRRVITADVEGGAVQACCIVVFLVQASYRSGAHRQDVDASVVGRFSFVSGNP